MDKKTKHTAKFRFNDNKKSNDIKAISVSYGISQDDIQRYYEQRGYNAGGNVYYNTAYVPMYYY